MLLLCVFVDCSLRTPSVVFGRPGFLVLLSDAVDAGPLVGLVVNWEETEHKLVLQIQSADGNLMGSNDNMIWSEAMFFFFVKLKRLWYTGHCVAMVTCFCFAIQHRTNWFSWIYFNSVILFVLLPVLWISKYISREIKVVVFWCCFSLFTVENVCKQQINMNILVLTNETHIICF